jgi:hypothetical protein
MQFLMSNRALSVFIDSVTKMKINVLFKVSKQGLLLSNDERKKVYEKQKFEILNYKLHCCPGNVISN